MPNIPAADGVKCDAASAAANALHSIQHSAVQRGVLQQQSRAAAERAESRVEGKASHLTEWGVSF